MVVYNYDSLGNYVCGDTIHHWHTISCAGSTGGSCGANVSLNPDSTNCGTMNYNAFGGPYSNIWWDFGDGNSSSNNISGSHTYVVNGTYTVEMVVYNYDSLGNYLCGDTITLSYTVNCAGGAGGSCNATLTTYADSTDCMTMNYHVSGGPYSNIWWDFGDGNYSNVLTSGSHTYASNGTYNVEVVVYNFDSLGNFMCGDTINKLFTVNCAGLSTGGNCNETLSLYADSSDCSAMNYYVSGGPYTYVWWDFGDGNSSNVNSYGVHTYAVDGVYNVEVYVYNYDSLGNYICGDTISQYYTVNCGSVSTGNSCNASMSLYMDSSNCGTMNYFVTGGPYSSVWWDFGDGDYANVLTSGSHTYAASGTYNVEVYVYSYDSLGNYICGDTISQAYTVNCVVGVEEISLELETTIYPNPITSGNDLNIEISSSVSQELTVRLVSMVGQVISQNVVQISEGDSKFTVPTNGLPSGIYLVRLNNLDGVLKTERFIVK
jgi:PKD repeat protein